MAPEGAAGHRLLGPVREHPQPDRGLFGPNEAVWDWVRGGLGQVLNVRDPRDAGDEMSGIFTLGHIQNQLSLPIPLYLLALNILA